MFIFKQNTEGLIHCGITTALDGCNPSQAAPRHARSHRALTSNKCQRKARSFRASCTERGPSRVLSSVLLLRAQCKVTAPALVPLDLQTDVWAAGTRDDGDETSGGGMAAALITRAALGWYLCAFSSPSHPAGVQAAPLPSRGAEPPVGAAELREWVLQALQIWSCWDLLADGVVLSSLGLLCTSSAVFHLKLGTHSKPNLQPGDALGVCLVIVSLPCS